MLDKFLAMKALNNARGGGSGGGGMPAGVPYFGQSEKVSILPECQWTFDEDLGAFAAPKTINGVVEGETYVVRYNGVDYTCTASIAGGQVGLGNIGAVTGGEDTGEPFVVAIVYHDDGTTEAVAIPIDGATEVTIGICGMRNKWLINGKNDTDIEWLPTRKTRMLVEESTFTKTGTGGDRYLHIQGNVIEDYDFIDVIFDGVLFPNVPVSKRLGGTRIWCKAGNRLINGDVNEDTGEPFFISSETNPAYPQSSYTHVLAATDGEHTVTIIGVVYRSKMPEEYLPDGIRSGGSSAPSDWNASEGEPGHILNRPFYSKFGIMDILPETEAVYSENDGAFAIMNPISLEDGKEYTVRWNGVEYVCSAFAVDGVLPVTVLGLGDIGAMSGELSGDYPFFIMAFPDSLFAELGMGVGIYPLDGSTDLTISISGEAEMVRKLDGKYLPDGLPRSKIDNGTVLPETTGVYVDGAFAMEGERFVLVPGYEYTVTWNGVTYVCTATYTSFDGIRVTALGDINVLSGGEPTGTVPFVIVPVTLEMGLEAGFSALAIPTDGATSLTISITGAIETVTTIAEKYLPPSARTYVIQKIGLGALTAGATFTDMDVNYDVIADILYSGGSVQIEASGVRHFPVAWKYDTEENTLILYLGVPGGVQPCVYKFIKGTWTPPEA